MCMTVPYEGAGNVDRENSVWHSEAVTEEHQRDESTVHDALMRIHINQHRSLSYRGEAVLVKQVIHHGKQLCCAEVTPGLEFFCGLIFNQCYNLAPQASDDIRRMQCQENILKKFKPTGIQNVIKF